MAEQAVTHDDIHRLVTRKVQCYCFVLQVSLTNGTTEREPRYLALLIGLINQMLNIIATTTPLLIQI